MSTTDQISPSLDSQLDMINVPIQHVRLEKAKVFLTSHLGISILLSIATVIVFYIINPPIIQTISKDGDIDTREKNPVRLFVIGILVFLISYLFPLWFKNKKNES